MTTLTTLSRSIRLDRTIITNAGSLIGTNLATNGLGVVFWWLAARNFVKAEVGIGSAAIAAMVLLGGFSTLGYNTLIVGEAARRGRAARPLVSAALLLTGTTAFVAGTLFALVAPLLSENFAALSDNLGVVVLFAFGVSLSSVGFVLDQALIGYLKGNVQFARNAGLSLGKLILIAGMTLVAAWQTGIGIYAAWTLGNLVSIVAVGVYVLVRVGEPRSFMPRMGSLRGVRLEALSHHGFNLSVQAPWLVLPIMVTGVLSASTNASFYAAAMIVSFVLLMPSALTSVLYAVSAGDPSTMQRRIRMTLSLSLGIAASALVVIESVPHLLLSVFGEQYADEASTTLRLLALGVLPAVVKSHWIAVRRIRREVGGVLKWIVAGTALIIASAYLGARIGGLNGLALGWLLAEGVQAAFMAPFVARVVGVTSKSIPFAITWPALRGPARTMAMQSSRSDATGLDMPVQPQPQPPAPERAGASPSGRRTIADEDRTADWAIISVIALSAAVGVALVAVGFDQARETSEAGRGLFWFGLGAIFIPTAGWALQPESTHRELVGSVLIVGLALYLVKVLYAPTSFVAHDELGHLRGVRDIIDSGRLYSPNPIVVAYPSYPGLTGVTAVLSDISGMSVHTAGTVIIGLARLLMLGSILALLQRITGSTRIAALASLVYMGNSNFIFFDAQFAYESLALPLALVALAAASRSRYGGDGPKVLPTWIPFAVSAAVVVTHHMSTLALAGALVAWTILHHTVFRSSGRPSPLPLALWVLALFGLWSLTVSGSATQDELGGVFSSTLDGVIGLIGNRGAGKAVFGSAGTGQAEAQWIVIAGLASVALLLAGLAVGLLVALRSRRLNALSAVLLLSGLLYPVTLAVRLTPEGTELANRASEFVGLGLGLAVAIGIVGVRSRLQGRVARNPSLRPVAAVTGLALLAGLTVIFIGGLAVGTAPYSRLPGPYIPAAEARSVDPEGLAAARWADRTLPPRTKIAADRINGLLMAAYGGVDPQARAVDGVAWPTLYLSRTFGSDQRKLIRGGRIRYVLVDRRLTTALPATGFYFASGEPGSDDRTRPLPAAFLDKFETAPGFRRVYDSGNIVIYDTQQFLRSRS